MRVTSAAELDLQGIVRPGDHVVWGQATGEPQTLTERLVAQRSRLGPLSVFVGASFSDTLQVDRVDGLSLSGYGAIGTLAPLARSGQLQIVPCHVGQIARYIQDGRIGCDVAFVQVSPPGPDGRCSYGVIHDYTPAAVAAARTVVAEFNEQVPWTHGSASLGPEQIDLAVHSSRPVLSVPPAPIGELERAIAGYAGRYIDDGSILQIGIGAIPDAILQSIRDRRDLGLHSGMVGDALVDLIECGALTNARKPLDRGVSISGALIGSQRLYEHVHHNPAIGMRESAYTHGDAVLARLPGLVSINSAVEVDLTGQVNAEQAGSHYLGGTGGQVDFVRAGHRSPGGCSIIAFAATARHGSVSRICAQLSGPVTTARSEVDVVITEYGAAELRAQPLRERARRLIAIAHPDFREGLEREAHTLFQRGY